MEAEAPLFARPAPPDEIWGLAAALYAEGGRVGDWFWSGHAFDFWLDLDCGGERRKLRYRRAGNGSIMVSYDGRKADVTLIEAEFPNILFETSGVRRRAIAVWSDANLHLSVTGSTFVFSEPGREHDLDASGSEGRIASPVAGVVIDVSVRPGQYVQAGQPLALIEAMKMETRVTAIHAGRVTAVHAVAGAPVANAALLFEIETLDEPANV
jgi:biotin carboxyl carrier protein